MEDNKICKKDCNFCDDMWCTLRSTQKNKTKILNVYILQRQDDWIYDEPIEQTIVTSSKEKAIALASKYPGVWGIKKEVDLTTEQVLTIDRNEG